MSTFIRRFLPRFDDATVEARYRQAHLDHALPSIRRALVVTALIESAWIVPDVALNTSEPALWKKLLLMRFCVWIPLLLAPLALSYAEWGLRHLMTILGVMVVTFFYTRGTVTFSTLGERLRIDTFFGLLMVVVLPYFILGLPIRVLYLTGLAISVMYALLARQAGLPPHLVFMHSFIALILGGACMFGAHQLEAAERRDFSASDALRQAQADLVRAERMASVAALVRGIAHELNNPVGFIAGNVPALRAYCEFLGRVATTLADGQPRSAEERAALTRFSPKKDLAFVTADLTRVMDDIAEGARRSSLIISDLQSLTTTGQRQYELIDLHRVVAQTVTLLSPRLPPQVRLTTEVTWPEADRFIARAGQLEQVLVNLVDNAIRAVGIKGEIKVQVSRAVNHAVIVVGDDGPGMTDEVKRRALEPFFTTRPPGEGSGLGLAIAASIVRGHRGTLELDSAPGRGTRVVLRLPIEDSSVAVQSVH